MNTVRVAFCAVFVLCFGLAGCNVFDGLYEEGSSTDPQVLITDAQAAMQDGRSGDAVTYLRKAHQADPDDIEIRVELASALLSHHKVDIILVADLAHDSGSDSDSASKTSSCPEDVACNFECTAMKSVTAFSYADSKAYLRLEQVLNVLQDVEELVTEPLARLGAEPGSRFTTEAGRRALFSALLDLIAKDHPREKARRLAATLLLDLGITKLSTTITAIQQSASFHQVRLYHVERMDGSRVVDYCGANVDQFIAETMCTIGDAAHFTLDMLQTRLENFSAEGGAGESSIAADLVDFGHDLFDGLTSAHHHQCTAG